MRISPLTCMKLLYAVLLFSAAALSEAQISEKDAKALKGLIEAGSGKDDDVVVETKITEKRAGETIGDTRLIIETVPIGASVYLNNSYYGVTPLTLKNLASGGYRLSLSKERYKTTNAFIVAEAGKTVKVTAVLKEPTGTLKIAVSPDDAEITAGLYSITSAETKLPVGDYPVRIRKFGYTEITRRITIEENRTTALEAGLLPAEFAIEDLSLSREILNPENPGLLGTLEFGFAVTSHGRGVLSVLNDAGVEVYSFRFPSFTTWSQSKRWNGRGSKYETLPDGIYTAVVEAENLPGGKKLRLERQFRIDRSHKIAFRNLFSGQAGLLFSPTSYVLRPDSFQIVTNISGLTYVKHDANFEDAYLVQTGAVFGLFPGLELSPLLSLGTTPNEETPDVIGSLGVKYRLPETGGPLSFAVTAKGVVSSKPSCLGFSQFPGLSLGGVSELRLGPFALTAAPELQFSVFPPGPSIESWEDRSFHAWASGRFALYLDAGSVLAGFSTALTSKSFSEGFGLVSVIPVGFELHWMVPETLFFLGAHAIWEYHPGGSDRVFVGGGLGIIY